MIGLPQSQKVVGLIPTQVLQSTCMLPLNRLAGESSIFKIDQCTSVKVALILASRADSHIWTWHCRVSKSIFQLMSQPALGLAFTLCTRSFRAARCCSISAFNGEGGFEPNPIPLGLVRGAAALTQISPGISQVRLLKSSLTKLSQE